MLLVTISSPQKGKVFPCHVIMVWGVCNMGYTSETHFKLKSREISFVHNTRFNCPIILKLCTEHGSDTAVLCAIFQNDWKLDMAVMNEQDFMRF